MRKLSSRERDDCADEQWGICARRKQGDLGDADETIEVLEGRRRNLATFKVLYSE